MPLAPLSVEAPATTITLATLSLSSPPAAAA